MAKGPRGGAAAARPLLLVARLDCRKLGSLEDQLAALGAAVVAGGGRAVLFVPRPPAPPVAHRFERAGLEVRAVDLSGSAAALVSVARAVRALGPALIHGHFIAPLDPLARALSSSGAALLLTEHMTPGHGPPAWRPVKRALHRRASPAALRLAVSCHVARAVVARDGTPPSRVRLVENGVDLSRFAGPPRREARAALSLDGEQPVIACVARLHADKGVDVAIEALCHLRTRATLCLLGDGPGRAALQARAAALGLDSQVRFLGLRDDVELLLAAADQAWVPSRTEEAFGLAAAEAMAAGRPVLASATGGLREVVADGVTGLLFPPGDAAALAAHAQALLDDQPRAARLGAAGRVRAAARFGMARFVSRVLALYREAGLALPRQFLDGA